MEYIKTEDISRMWEGSYSVSWSLSETVPHCSFLILPFTRLVSTLNQILSFYELHKIPAHFSSTALT